MGEVVYTGLTIDVRRDSDLGEYQIGVELDGAFIPLARPTLGFVEEQQALARERANTPPVTAPGEPAPPTGPIEAPPATA